MLHRAIRQIMDRSSELPIGDPEVRAVKGSIGVWIFPNCLGGAARPHHQQGILPTPGRNSVIAVVWPKVRITLSLAPQLD
jgi:hypothetical protein